MKLHTYKVLAGAHQGYGVRVIEYDDGWFTLAALPKGKENIFSSVKEIETVTGVQLTLYSTEIYFDSDK